MAALAVPAGVRVVDGRYRLSTVVQDTASAGSHVTAGGDIHLATRVAA